MRKTFTAIWLTITPPAAAFASVGLDLALDAIPTETTFVVEAPVPLLQSDIQKTDTGIPFRVWSTIFVGGEPHANAGLNSHCVIRMEDWNLVTENPVVQSGNYEIVSVTAAQIRNQKVYTIQGTSDSKQKVTFECRSGWGISVFQHGVFKVRNFNTQFSSLIHF